MSEYYTHHCAPQFMLSLHFDFYNLFLIQGMRKLHITLISVACFVIIFFSYLSGRNNIALVTLYGENTRGDSPHRGAVPCSSRRCNKYKCLSADTDLLHLIASTNQVIITMPAKAAGTSLKVFATQCNDDSYSQLQNNFLNNETDLSKILTNSLRVPPVVASHMYTSEPLIYLIENIPRSTLLIYAHRDETSRLQAAIHHVVDYYCEQNRTDATRDGNDCHISEDNLIENIIKPKMREIDFGASEVLPCGTYEAIKANAPTMVFMNYKNANVLQHLVARKYCPHIMYQATELNVASKKKHNLFVLVNVKNLTAAEGGVNNATASQGGVRNTTSAEGRVERVLLKDWLKAKESTLEWALGLNRNGSCKAKTRKMEDELLSCQDGFLDAAAEQF